MNGGIIGGLLPTSLPNTTSRSGLWTLKDVYNSQNRIRATPLIIHNFDTTLSVTRGSVGLSTTNKVEGVASLWLSKTTTSSDYSEIYKFATFDFSTKSLFRVWVYISDQTAYDSLTLDAFFLDLGSSINSSYRYKLQKSLCTIGQWTLLTKFRESPDEICGTPPAWNNITYCRIAMRTPTLGGTVASEKVFFDYWHAV